jgi:hypothetical protein
VLNFYVYHITFIIPQVATAERQQCVWLCWASSLSASKQLQPPRSLCGHSSSTQRFQSLQMPVRVLPTHCCSLPPRQLTVSTVGSEDGSSVVQASSGGVVGTFNINIDAESEVSDRPAPVAGIFGATWLTVSCSVQEPLDPLLDAIEV